MRSLLVLLGLCAVTSAGTRVVVLGDRGDLPPALQVALSPHAEVVTQPAQPAGEVVLDRAAAAQRVAVSSNADASVWVDGDEVWVVSADGRDVRHAPLSGDASPRTFAAVAASLLDELLAPPEKAHIGVDVHVDITPPAAAPPVVAVAPPPMQPVAVAPPTLVEPVIATAAPYDPFHNRHAMIDVGATGTNATAGIEAEALFPIGHSAALGVTVGFNQGIRYTELLDNGQSLFDAAAELRHVGTGTTHFDYGLVAGIGDESGGGEGAIAALRLGVTHELDTFGVGFSLAPTLLVGFYQDNPVLTLMASLHLELRI